MTFYESLPELRNFETIFNENNFQKVPEDWFVVVTDVINSTKAIADGRYKDVNTAGSIAAMAISNIRKDMQFPFVFGGDGMTYLVPPEMAEQTRHVLADTRQIVRQTLNLTLRVGIVLVSDLYDDGFTLAIAKLRVSDRYVQAVFNGNGLMEAENRIKDPEKGKKYLVPEEFPVTLQSDFSGYTCRWEDIPSSKGETISLLVKVREVKREHLILPQIVKVIHHFFGSEDAYHPLAESKMSLTHSNDRINVEAAVLSGKKAGLRFRLARRAIKFQIWFVCLINKLNIRLKIAGKNLNEVKKDNVVSSDYRKYDGVLKMVVSCTLEQRKKIQNYFKKLYDAGMIYYGIHVSDRALLTCLLHYNSGSEVHFVDAADGGYALAARQMKRQIRNAQKLS